MTNPINEKMPEKGTELPSEGAIGATGKNASGSDLNQAFIKKRIHLLETGGVSSHMGLYPGMIDTIAHRVLSGEDVLVIFSDVDGTFTPARGDMNDRLKVIQTEAMTQFAELVTKNNYVFIPITGSSYEVSTPTLESLQQRIGAGEIAEVFHALIVEGASKAVIKGKGSTEFSYDEHYASFVRERAEEFRAGLPTLFKTCDEQLEAVRQQMLTIKGMTVRLAEFSPAARDLYARVLGRELHDADRIQYQPHAHPQPGQAPLDKISLYFLASTIVDRDRIEKLFVEKFRGWDVICCEERDFNSEASKVMKGERPLTRYCIDIAPINKATPIELFTRLITETTTYFNQTFKGNSKVIPVYFGDAGNDIPAARANPIRKVGIVSGASREFLRKARDLPPLGKDVYVDSKAGRPGVASILTALKEWGYA